MNNEKLIDKKSLKQSIFNIYNSSSNKKLVEEEFNYCLDCINSLINELELTKGSENIYRKALELSIYKKLYKELNWKDVPVSDLVKQGLILIEKKRILEQVEKEYLNGK